MDGVVVTRGTEREHVWTFAASLTESGWLGNVCPCTNSQSTQSIPSFVGQDYSVKLVLLVVGVLYFTLMTHSGMERTVGQEVLAASCTTHHTFAKV